MTYHWLYGRLNAHVGWDDAKLMGELDAYADEHVKGGHAVLTDAHRDGIRKEHADAQALYSTVMRGTR